VANTTLGLPTDLHDYLRRVAVREPAVLRRLRAETASMPEANMQIAPEQGALMALLAELTGARRCLELGTFTGYSALAVALVLPPGGRVVCCDMSREWTDVGRRFWAEAGVDDRIEVRIGPALDSLDAMINEGASDSVDFAFVDAAKEEYPAYYERLMRLVRRGGLMLFDNVFWGGDVVNPEVDDSDVRGIRELNERLAADERVTVAMVPLADGLTLVRRR
jgi:predicted O-methyltransferase YrrM